MIKYLLIFVISLFCLSCSEDVAPSKGVHSAGIVVENSASFFMYGSHLLIQEEDSIAYALTSSTINLDVYVNQKVHISGKAIAGYPVAGGPVYVEVYEEEIE